MKLCKLNLFTYEELKENAQAVALKNTRNMLVQETRIDGYSDCWQVIHREMTVSQYGQLLAEKILLYDNVVIDYIHQDMFLYLETGKSLRIYYYDDEENNPVKVINFDDIYFEFDKTSNSFISSNKTEKNLYKLASMVDYVGLPKRAITSTNGEVLYPGKTPIHIKK